MAGIAVASEWFGITPRAYADKNAAQLDLFETVPGREMAERELAETRAKLMLHVL